MSTPMVDIPVTVHSPKPKVVFVLGATATGKSKLGVALCKHFGGEVINADKIQVYDGLHIIVNKVTEERAGVPHHLLGVVCNTCACADFTAEDFRCDAAAAVDRIVLPVGTGGSNSYIESLVEGDGAAFRKAHDCLFIWLDAEQQLLEWHTSARVDDVMRAGAVHEARATFVCADGDADYTCGVRRAIGLPEMHDYHELLEEGGATEAELANALAHAMQEMKDNTSRLARAQSEKIQRLSRLDGWDVRRVDMTAVLLHMADGAAFRDNTWEKDVWEPCKKMVQRFLGYSAPDCPELQQCR